MRNFCFWSNEQFATRFWSLQCIHRAFVHRSAMISEKSGSVGLHPAAGVCFKCSKWFDGCDFGREVHLPAAQCGTPLYCEQCWHAHILQAMKRKELGGCT